MKQLIKLVIKKHTVISGFLGKVLNRVIVPKYRIVIEMKEHGVIRIQRQGLLGGWRYLEDSMGMIEYTHPHHAFVHVDNMHKRREYEVSILALWGNEK